MCGVSAPTPVPPAVLDELLDLASSRALGRASASLGGSSRSTIPRGGRRCGRISSLCNAQRACRASSGERAAVRAPEARRSGRSAVPPRGVRRARPGPGSRTGAQDDAGNHRLFGGDGGAHAVAGRAGGRSRTGLGVDPRSGGGQRRRWMCPRTGRSSAISALDIRRPKMIRPSWSAPGGSIVATRPRSAFAAECCGRWSPGTAAHIEWWSLHDRSRHHPSAAWQSGVRAQGTVHPGDQHAWRAGGRYLGVQPRRRDRVHVDGAYARRRCSG